MQKPGSRAWLVISLGRMMSPQDTVAESLWLLERAAAPGVVPQVAPGLQQHGKGSKRKQKMAFSWQTGLLCSQAPWSFSLHLLFHLVPSILPRQLPWPLPSLSLEALCNHSSAPTSMMGKRRWQPDSSTTTRSARKAGSFVPSSAEQRGASSMPCTPQSYCPQPGWLHSLSLEGVRLNDGPSFLFRVYTMQKVKKIPQRHSSSPRQSRGWILLSAQELKPRPSLTPALGLSVWAEGAHAGQHRLGGRSSDSCWERGQRLRRRPTQHPKVRLLNWARKGGRRGGMRGKEISQIMALHLCYS